MQTLPLPHGGREVVSGRPSDLDLLCGSKCMFYYRCETIRWAKTHVILDSESEITKLSCLAEDKSKILMRLRNGRLSNFKDLGQWVGATLFTFSSSLLVSFQPRETEELSMKQIKQTKKDANLQPDQEVNLIVENLKLLTRLAQPNFRPQIDLLITKSKNYAIHIYELLRKMHQVGCVENNWKISAHNISM
ncbi:hypothetical protein MTR67_032770 [Solanum verrucosum]|uniref:Uncharacterized protein n=1 Tax=Solanum verrucosum TaxID=315347 RepID=A0AAF0U4U4_SOLVR|nr:hypothetical protein MTR67_032770 [Solanum verrucosum]